jgi:hypothetical protein
MSDYNIFYRDPRGRTFCVGRYEANELVQMLLTLGAYRTGYPDVSISLIINPKVRDGALGTK